VALPVGDESQPASLRNAGSFQKTTGSQVDFDTNRAKSDNLILAEPSAERINVEV
jgi:hypothetical protein